MPRRAKVCLMYIDFIRIDSFSSEPALCATIGRQHAWDRCQRGTSSPRAPCRLLSFKALKYIAHDVQVYE